VSPRLDKTLGRARGALAGFTPGQRGVVLVAVAALLLGAYALSRWVSQPQWTPLFGNLSGADANSIVEQLSADGVEYRLTDGGATVLVPQSSVYDLRVRLSGQGLPSAGAEGGYSLLDEQGMTATDFQQNVAFRRALEGELSNTLQAMDGVRSAVVHLALPEKDVFASEQVKPTASVLLALQSGKTLSREQVTAVTHLVAGSIEGLEPDQVTVTDSSGQLLSVPGDGSTGTSAAAGETDEQTARYEQRVSSAVQQMLDRVVGSGRSVVRVNARLNFDTTDTTSENYTYPTEIPPLSDEESTEGYSARGEATGGTLGQTWPTLGAETGTGTDDDGRYSKQQRTRNNAVDKTVSRSQVAPGRVERLSVAVILDARAAGSLDPIQIQDLVGNAVGLDPERGDSVQVTRLPFDTSAAETATKELAAAEKAAKTQGYVDLGKKSGFGLVLLIAMFLAIRMGRRGRGTSVQVTAQDLPETPAGVLVPSQVKPALQSGPATASLATDAERQHMREHIAELVEKQPEEMAAVIQSWLAERSG